MFERLKKRVVVAATLLLAFCGLQLQAGVAKVGDTEYATLKAAFTSVPDGGTVQLIADVTEGVLLPVDYNTASTVTLDLNGHKLTGSMVSTKYGKMTYDIADAAIVLDHDSSLTVKDTQGSGSVENSSNGVIFYQFGADVALTIEGGRYATSDLMPLVTFEEEVFTEEGALERDPINLTVNVKGGSLSTLDLVSSQDELAQTEFTCAITGGSFGENPSSFLADDWRADMSDDVYLVQAKKYIAQIVTQSGVNKYETLEAAVGAAVDGNTITMIADSSESLDKQNGIVVPANKFGTNGLTIDLNGFTYTCNGTPVGSTGTENQAFQLLAGNNITFSSAQAGGKLEVAEDVAANFRFVIQNYANLTLDGVIVDGTNLRKANKSHYTVSNNNGTSEFKNGTQIIAYTEGEKNFAFDVCRNSTYPAVSVTVNGATIKGDVEVTAENGDLKNGCSLNLTAAIFEGSKLTVDESAARATVTKGSSVAVTLDPLYPQYGWDANNKLVVNVAQIGENKYTTLAAAVAAAQSGDTVKLLMDVPLAQTVEINTDLTFNLNGKNITATDVRALHVKSGTVSITGEGTISANGDNLNVDSSVIRVGDAASNPANPKAASLTIGPAVTVASAKCYGVTVFGRNEGDHKLSLTVNGTVAVTGARSAISGTGNSYDGPAYITIAQGARVSSTGDYAIYNPQAGTLTVEGTVSGGIEAKAGTVNVSSTATITARNVGTSHEKNNNGPSTQGYALAVVNNAGYVGGATLNVSGGTIDGPLVVVTDEGATTENGKIAVSGGSFSMVVPEEYCASNWVPVYDPVEGRYVVEVGEFVARDMATERGYKTLAAAVAAVESGKTIRLLKKNTLANTVEIDKDLTLDLNGFNIEATATRALHVKSGTVTIDGIGRIENGNETNPDSSVIRVGDSAYNPVNAAAASLTIGSNVVVSTSKSYGISVFGRNEVKPLALTVYGTVEVTDVARSAISGTGNSYDGPATITIAEGAVVSSANDYAIYNPQAGTLTVAGTVTGLGGIEAKGGTVTVASTASVTATAAAQSHTKNTNGPSTSGYALAVVNNAGYPGAATIAVTGGTINGLLTIENDDETVGTGKFDVTGGSFSQSVLEEYCNEAYIPTDLGEGRYGVKLGAYVAKIVTTEGTTKYETVQEALTVAAAATDDSKTVTLLRDVRENGLAFNMGTKNVILDLNGFVLTSDINVTAAVGSKLQFTINNPTVKKDSGKVVGDITVTNGKLSIPRDTSNDTTVEGSIVLNNVADSDIKGTVKQSDPEKAAITVNGTLAQNYVKIANTTVIDAAGVAIAAQDGSVKVLSNNSTSTAKIKGSIDKAGSASVAITGGCFANDVSGLLADDYMVVESGDGVYTYGVVKAEAKIGETKYETLQDALTAAAAETDEAKTVTLVRNVTNAGGLTFAMNNKNVILDLNGFVLTSDITVTAAEGSKLQFTVKNPIAKTNGKLVGDITLTNGKLVISRNSTLDTTVEGSIVLNNVADSDIQGTVKQTDSSKAAITVNGTLAQNYVKIANTAVIDAAGVAIAAQDGSVKVLTNSSTSTAKIKGTITKADGASVAMTGGRYSVDVGSVLPADYMLVETVDADYKYELVKAYAQIGETKYTTIQGALTEAAAATDSAKTVTLLRDATVDAGLSFAMNNTNVILDLNGFVLKSDITVTAQEGSQLQFTVKNPIAKTDGKLVGDITLINGKLEISRNSTLDTTVEGSIVLNNVAESFIRGTVKQTDSAKAAITVNGTLAGNSVKVTNVANIDAAGVAIDAQDGSVKVLSNSSTSSAKIKGTITKAGSASVAITGGLYSGDLGGLLSDEYMIGANTDVTTKTEYPYLVAEAVAKIGTTKYATLAEAFSAVPNNGRAATRIDLVRDCSGAGVALWSADKKWVNLYFNNHTYTITNSPVGSSGTESQGFHFEQGSRVILRDGTLTSTKESGVLMLIQNYDKLTLSGMTIDGTNLPGDHRYVLSNNSGSIDLTNYTKIYAKEGDIALDSCKYGDYDIPTVALNSYTYIEGDIELSGGNLTIDSLQGHQSFRGVLVDSGIGEGRIVKTERAEIVAPNGYMWHEEGFGTNVLRKSVAKIDDTTYASLAEAIDAVSENETITLLADMTIGGISIPSGKNFTLDFDRKTVTFECPGAGSAGTKTIGFQILKDSTITFKNGTINCSETNKGMLWNKDATKKGIAMVIQNYANLTLDDMIIDGTNIAHNGGNVRYVMSNNSGTVAITGTTSITAASGDYAFDTCKYDGYNAPSVTLNTTGAIEGKVDLSGGDLNLDSGVFTKMTLDGTVGDLAKVQVKGGLTIGAPEGWAWTSGADEGYAKKLAPVVAQVGDAFYGSLADAVAAAATDDTVTLLKDVSLAAQVEIAAKALTLDLNSKTISWNGGDLASGLLLVHNGAALTINDGSESGTGKILSGTTAYAAVALTKKGDDATNPAVLTVNAGALEGHLYAVCGNGSRSNTLVTVNGGILTGTNEGEGGSHAIYNPQEGNVVVNGGTLSGYWSAIEMRGGSLEVSDGTLTSRATEYACNPNGNGSTTIGAAVAIVQHTTKKPLALNVTGGTFNGEKAISESNPQENDPAPQVTMSVSGGTFNGGLAITDVTQFVTGGDFAEFVLEQYCAAGYIPTDANEQGRYGVEAGKFLARNMTTGKGYKTLPDAVAAVPSGVEAQTIKLLEDDITGPGVIVKAGQNVVIDFDGKVYTVNENVGSTGSKTSGFQLLAGSTVELKNGTLTSTTAKILIQNYSDLTLTDMNLDGTKSEVCTYVVSNNNGSLDVKGATSITAKEGAKAFDVCVTGYYPNGVDVTIGTTGTITGDIEYGVWGNLPALNETSLTITNGTFIGNWVIDSRLADDTEERINISGGTYSVAVPEIYCKDGFIPKDLGEGRYGVQEGFYVARLVDERGEGPKVILGSYTNFVDTIAALKAQEDYEGLIIKLVHAGVTENLSLPNGVFFETTGYQYAGTLSAEDIHYTTVQIPMDRTIFGTECRYVARVGDNWFETLTAALTATTTVNGSTVTIMKDFTESVKFPVSSRAASEVTIDFNGFVMTGADYQWSHPYEQGRYGNLAFVIGDYANLTLTNSASTVGGIYAAEIPAGAVDDYRTFFVEGWNAQVTIADGVRIQNTINPTVMFYTDYYGAYTDVNFTLNIAGGEFVGDSIVIDPNAMPLTDIDVNVSGGWFVDANLTDFTKTADISIAITGGTYWGEIDQANLDRYLVEDYMSEKNTDDNWFVRPMVIVAKNVSADGTVTNKYESLGAAIAGAQDGGSVYLLTNIVEGAGITIQSQFPTSLTIDLGGFTYTGAKDPAGSTGSKSQLLQILKDNKVTIQNGTLNVTEGTTDFLMLVQNYADLTLTNVVLDGSNLAGTGRYVLSNNSGIVVVGAGTTVTAKEGDIAIDTYEFGTYPIPSVTINGATVTGLIEVTGGNLDLSSGDFSSIALRGDVKSGMVQKPATDETLLPPAGWAWTTTGADEGKVRLATAVAKIGTTTYASLLEAVAAVPVEGTTTIDVLRSSEGAGIALFAADKKNITINLGTNTYTVVKDAVGSNGTKTQAFHFEEGNTVTINATTDAGDGKTGTLSATEGSGALMLVQNYCDLTLNGVVLDGTQLPGTGRYVLSNNSGNVTLTGGTTVTAKDRDIAIDSCQYATYKIPTLTINGATVTGSVELTGGNLELVAGTFNNMTLTGTVGEAKVQQSANGSVLPPEGWAWTTTGADEGKVRLAKAVAKIGTTTYASLVEAVAAVPVGGEDTTAIDLLCNSEGAGIALFEADQKNITLNLGTNTYTVVKDAVGSNGTQTQGFHFEKGNTVTITATTVDGHTGTLSSTADSGALILIQNYCNLTLDGVVLDGTKLPGTHRYVLSNNSGAVTLMGGTTVTAKTGDIAIDSCKYATYEIPTLTVNGATVTGQVELTGGDLELVSGTFDNMTLTGTVGSGRVQKPATDTSVLPPTGFAWTTTGADAGKVCLGKIVATINETVGYATLADAVAAAVNGDEIKLLDDFSGAGLFLPAGSKEITINLGGNTFTCTGPAVGSNGTETQALHLEAGNTVTITNGVITSSADSGVKMLVQNYCDLTLNGVELDGSNLPDSHRYVLSNNSGDVTLTGGTKVTAKAGDIAIDSCKYANYEIPTLTIDGATVTGPVELTGGNLELVSGTFDNMTLTGAVGGGRVQKPATDTSVRPPANFAWTTTGAEAGKVCLGTVVATINETDGYATLADAVAAAVDGDEIKLQDDFSGAGLFLPAGSKTITIDLGGNTFTCTGPAVGSNGTETQALHLEAGNTVTIKNGTITSAADSGVKMLVQNYANLTLVDVELVGTNLEGANRYVLSNNSGTVNLTGTTSVTAKSGDFAIDSCKYGSYPAPKVTLNTSGTITGKVELSGGDFYYQSGNMSGAVQTASNYADGQVTGFAARVGDVATASTLYFTLAEAVAAAPDAGKVTLLQEVNPEATIVMTKNLNLDLNGFSITSTNRAIQVKSGTVNITGTGTISSNGGTLNPDSSVIRVGDPTEGGASAALTLGTNVVVSTETCYGVTVFGRNDGLALTVYGTVSSTVRSAVSGTGNSYDGPTTITIAESATITTTDDYAIYNPQSGTLTIAGTVTGGIEAKAGTVTINEPAVVTARSAELGHATNNNGPSTQGYALAVVNNSGYQVPARITVNGGCIDGAVTNITDNTVLEPGRVVLKGGVYSNEGVAVYCDEALSLVTNPDPETKQAYPFAVLCDMYVYNDVETGLSVNFPRAWITSTNGLGLAAADATDEAIDAALATKTAHVMKWQYVLLGISDTNTGLLANFGKDANSTASDPKIFVTFKGLDATKQPTWETGITITYTLYTSEDASSWTAVTEGVTNTKAGVSYEMPTSTEEIKTWLYQLRVNMGQQSSR